MADCLITTGWSCPDCTSKFNIPGLERNELLIANKSEISAFTSATEGEVSAITFDTYKGFYRVCAHKDTASWQENLVVGANSGNHFTQTVTFRTIDPSTGVRNAIEDLVDVDVVVAVKSKRGDWWILGEDAGLRLTSNDKDSGAATGDDQGDLLTFSGVALGKARKFFITDAATTETTIDGYVVG